MKRGSSPAYSVGIKLHLELRFILLRVFNTKTEPYGNESAMRDCYRYASNLSWEFQAILLFYIESFD